VIMLAALLGAVAGVAAIFVMFHNDMLQERSGAAVLLAAIAVFYPVFAAIEGDLPGMVLHAVIFMSFAWLAIRGFRLGLHLIAGGMIAHGLFDVTGLTRSPILRLPPSQHSRPSPRHKPITPCLRSASAGGSTRRT